MVTTVAPVKPVPVIVTVVPPATGPVAGEILVNVGIEIVSEYVKDPVPVTDPPGVMMTTFAVPAVPAGVVAVTDVSLTTVTLVACVPPMVTMVAPVKPLPVIVTEVPPAIGPVAGEMPANVGAGAEYVNAPVPVTAPPGVSMTTFAVPTVPVGVIAVIAVSLTTVTLVACVLPMITAVAPVKPLPVMVTEVPPAIGPVAGEMPANVGAGAE
jgi:hypothetical protein